MVRDRGAVLKSITGMLAEVQQVAGMVNNGAVPDRDLLDGNLVASFQVTQITYAIIKFHAENGQGGADFKTLEGLVAKTLNSSVRNWLETNVGRLAQEAVRSELQQLGLGSPKPR